MCEKKHDTKARRTARSGLNKRVIQQPSQKHSETIQTFLIHHKSSTFADSIDAAKMVRRPTQQKLAILLTSLNAAKGNRFLLEFTHTDK